jgi:hypothetical protein
MRKLTSEHYNAICGDKGDWIGVFPKNSKTKTMWICWECGDCFMARYNSVHQGQWCSKCYGNKPLTKDDYNTVCGDKGEWIGVLPKNCMTKTMWNCLECGDCFMASYSNVQQGQWCPSCSKSRTEKLCREYIEKKFNRKFLSCKPSFLINESGHLLELDMYNEELSLAFEYNGIQHYKFIPLWHKTHDKFEAQKQRDFIKKELCRIFEIRLIIIPYTVNCYDPQKLYDFIDSFFK